MEKTQQRETKPQLELHPIDRNALAEIRTFRDGKGSSITIATPAFPGIKSVMFLGETVLQFSNGQAVPVRFEIVGATDIESACDLWPEQCQAACLKIIAQVEKQMTRAKIVGANGAAL